MRLPLGHHLGYCTNIHRGETWAQTLDSLNRFTLRVRDAVCPGEPYGIGLRLSRDAARELADPPSLAAFREWLREHNAYVFTINGFPYGRFHGGPVKEQVYVPDWTDPARLDYTTDLFDLLARLGPANGALSVSTLPGSFKEFIRDDSEVERICDLLNVCSCHIEDLRQREGRDFHLGLEPEPLGLFETTEETARFFEKLMRRSHSAERIRQTIGVNYDTCHLAVEFESASEGLDRLADSGIRLSKLHLSSALALQPSTDAFHYLAAFQEDTYLHQVVVKRRDRVAERFRDLPPALERYRDAPETAGEEWRVHFHIPLHATPSPPFSDTRPHLEETLDWLRRHPDRCQHLEMETYTWEVLPENLRAGDVVDQLVREYEWTLSALKSRGLA